jgi:hypothetical protein
MQDAMTDAQLRHWAEHNQDHSSAARGVLRLLEDAALLRRTIFEETVSDQSLINRDECNDQGHLFHGGQWRCVCGKHTRDEFGESDRAPMPPMHISNTVNLPWMTKFDGSTGTPPHGVAGHKSEGAQ